VIGEVLPEGELRSWNGSASEASRVSAHAPFDIKAKLAAAMVKRLKRMHFMVDLLSRRNSEFDLIAAATQAARRLRRCQSN
jgi:hypothetical protein